MPGEGTGWGCLWLLGVAGAVAFLGWKLVPPYLDNADVSEALFDTLLTASSRSDDQLRQEAKRRLLQLGGHLEPAEERRFLVVPGIPVEDEQIVVTRDRGNNAIHMALDYDRGVSLWPLPKVITLHFHDVKTAQISHY